MKMKKLFKTTILVLTAVLVFACELDLAPENVMVDETTYKDARTSEAALLGAYTRLNASFSGAPTGINNYANTGYMLMFGEVGTPTLKVRENSSLINMESANYNSSDHESYILSMWRTTYNAIDYTNNIITNIIKFGDYDQNLMNTHIAEAKFLRAYEYLMLLQTFGDGALTGDMNGLGAVLRLTPYDGYRPEEVASRATVGETYEQILKDLNEALPHLPNPTANSLVIRTRASKTSAFALLSRVYLYRGTSKNDLADIKLAADYADSVLKNTKNYTFSTSNTHHTSWLFPLNPTSAETNSANYSDEVLLLSPSYSSVSKYSNGVGSSFYNKTSFYIDPEFTALYPAGDRRGYIDPATAMVSLIWQGSATSFPADMTTYKYNNGSGYNNVLYIRLSEIKLTRAEALARLNGINTESLQHLNDINKKAFATKPADFTAASFANAQELIDRILIERMKELAFEGHTRFDLIRTNKPLRVSSVPVEKKMLPVPEYDIKISYGKILQNKGFR
ncbi:MAG: hypothetical protein A2X17_02355 [Bacteroidetes bacterium GWF2_41_61]|nr:MAG: hypothetical protein A2X17_02355 [Bacteroidetes bacterium GWF2_41_61]OFY88904.1 MAG: hypothetical protein A2266_02730 [Bacteroidetes bacterium RIFOXYA12_FULL_40_10]